MARKPGLMLAAPGVDPTHWVHAIIIILGSVLAVGGMVRCLSCAV